MDFVEDSDGENGSACVGVERTSNGIRHPSDIEEEFQERIYSDDEEDWSYGPSDANLGENCGQPHQNLGHTTVSCCRMNEGYELKSKTFHRQENTMSQPVAKRRAISRAGWSKLSIPALSEKKTAFRNTKTSIKGKENPEIPLENTTDFLKDCFSECDSLWKKSGAACSQKPSNVLQNMVQSRFLDTNIRAKNFDELPKNVDINLDEKAMNSDNFPRDDVGMQKLQDSDDLEALLGISNALKSEDYHSEKLSFALGFDNSNSIYSPVSDQDNLFVVRRPSNNDEGRLENKIKKTSSCRSVNSGWGNNFVRIDLKRGKGSTKYASSKKKKMSYKRFSGYNRHKQCLRQVGDGADIMEGWGPEKLHSTHRCFRCGQLGHWASNCLNTESIDDDSRFTANISAAERTLNEDATTCDFPPQDSILIGEGESMSESSLANLNIEELCIKENLQQALLKYFGFDSFRSLQLDTIQDAIRGKSCLSIMPTGMGKSLCYQLPALLLPGLTVVVSPLIALMKDQCRVAPELLNPDVLWSGQTPLQVQESLEKIRSGETRLLFISPERIGNRIFLETMKHRSPISLLVIDEAHCVAEWGHSFRPAYFRLGKSLRGDLQARSVLALTATATRTTEASICSVLGIPKCNVRRDDAIRSNLRLTVTTKLSSNIDWEQIVQLFLQKGPLYCCKSVIVYCAWKDDADKLSKALLASGISSRSYHAGRQMKERSAIESAFVDGRIRVVVATVAFGMGINITTVDAVVHATMPRSLEEYVQQIGRAGRNSLARDVPCIAFIDDSEYVKLRSLAYSGIVLRDAVDAILDCIFSKPNLYGSHKKSSKNAPSNGIRQRYVCIDGKKVSKYIDVPEESIEAILGYLEAAEEPYIRILPKAPIDLKVSFYAVSPEQLSGNRVVAALLKVCPRPRNGLYSVKTSVLASAFDQNPERTLTHLQDLAKQKLIGFEVSNEMGFAFEIISSPTDLNTLSEALYQRLGGTLRCQVARLDACYRAFAAALVAADQSSQENILRKKLEAYFTFWDDVSDLMKKDVLDSLDLSGLPLLSDGEKTLAAAHALLRRNEVQKGGLYKPIDLAKILHGMRTIDSVSDLKRNSIGTFWGSKRNVDFPHVLKACNLAASHPKSH